MNQLLGDKNTYKVVRVDPTTKLQKKNNSIVNELYKGKHINYREKQQLASSAATAPRLYGLPKIHKPECPLRPISSSINVPCYELSIYLGKILTPLISEDYNIKNSFDLQNRLADVNVCNDDVKRSFWAGDGEVAILDLWEERAADLRSSRKNGHIYKEMANELAKLGYNYTARDIQVKIANFTQRYRKERVEMGPSGGSPSIWPFYARVNQIIGGFKANRFCELMLESIDESSTASSVPTTPSPQLTSTPSTPQPWSNPPSPLPGSSAIEPKKKKNIVSVHTKVMEKFEAVSVEITNYMKKSEENENKFMKIEEEKANALKETAQDNKEPKKAFVAINP
ncbi:uncharacterized protein [Eurosta solidaginis]|uniref:uncharacterized protein n=1 Tax=Eurosta solidaginis TaxID=178769 RepID=UPI00353164AF